MLTSMCFHFFLALYKHFEEHTNFLECMVNEHVFTNFVSLNKKFNSHEAWQNSECFDNHSLSHMTYVKT